MKYLALVLLTASFATAQQPVTPHSKMTTPTEPHAGPVFSGSLATATNAVVLATTDQYGQAMWAITMDRNARVIIRHYDSAGTMDWIVLRDGTFIPLNSDTDIDKDSQSFWKAMVKALQSASLTCPERK